MSNFHTTLFKIVLYWCLDLIRHNIGTHLKYNKYIFDISIPFCHHLYLCATLKQCFTEFAVSGNVVHHVYMSVRGRIPTCDLIGRLFLGSGLQRMCYLLCFKWVPILWRIRSSHQYKTILKKCCMNIWYLRFLPCVFFLSSRGITKNRNKPPVGEPSSNNAEF